MRGAFVAAARKRVTMADLPLISQWSGPLTASPKGEANTTKSRRFLVKEAAALFWRTRAQHIYYTTFTMCYSILIMHKYCI
jgi:hypothetical protein